MQRFFVNDEPKLPPLTVPLYEWRRVSVAIGLLLAELFIWSPLFKYLPVEKRLSLCVHRRAAVKLLGDDE